MIGVEPDGKLGPLDLLQRVVEDLKVGRQQPLGESALAQHRFQ